MGRHPLVDRQVALDRIMKRFWATGYEATSIDDLLEASGMHRGSFYRTFGDKQQAFLAALDRYMNLAADEHFVPSVEGRGSPTRRLLQLLYLRLDAALGVDGSRPGCLIVNTAIEVAPHDPATREVVSGGLGAVRDAIARLIRDAVEAGEVDPAVDTELACDQLFTLLQGVNVLARAGGERRHLRRLLQQTLQTTLEPTTSRSSS
jgi:TetR/AcrR family transcriptional repressor of nem operon